MTNNIEINSSEDITQINSWDFTKLKYVCKIENGSTPKSNIDEFWDDSLKWFTPYDFKNITNNFYLERPNRFISQKGLENSGCSFIKEESILLTTRAPVGKVAKIKGGFTFNQGCKSLSPKNLDIGFLYYSLQNSEQFLKSLSKGTTFKELSTDELLNFKIHIPELKIQKLISKFLDKKIQTIDNLIKKIEKKIELLKEQKTVLINQYVTKGLDQNIVMKDSGLYWVGDIPLNWERIKIKNIVSIKITDGPHETPKFEEFGVPFISAEGIVDNKINFNSKRGYINLETHKLYSKKCVPLRDDVLIVKSGSTTGKSAIVETDEIFNIWSPLCILRSNKELILPKFLFYCVQSRFFLNQVETSWSYGTQPNIGMGVIENLTLLLPPKNEQQLIVDILNNKLSNSNLLIEKNETKKNLLYEYRQSLISRVVTGKIRITEDMI